MNPIFTIIVACFDSSRHLKKCLDSIVNQTFSNFEVIIQDGSNCDVTKKLVAQYSDDRLRYFSENDTGIYHAWNLALDKSEGEWIAFLGSDDSLNNIDVLQHYYSFINESCTSSDKLIYSNINYVLEDGKVRGKKGSPWVDVKDKFKYEMSIPHPMSLHHKSLFEKYGQFNTDFKIVADYDFLLRVYKDYDFKYVKDLLAVDFSLGGVSNNASYLQLKEIYKLRRLHQIKPVFMPSIYIVKMILSSFRSLFKS